MGQVLHGSATTSAIFTLWTPGDVDGVPCCVRFQIDFDLVRARHRPVSRRKVDAVARAGHSSIPIVSLRPSFRGPSLRRWTTSAPAGSVGA